MECDEQEVHTHSTEKQHLNGFTLTSNTPDSQDIEFKESNCGVSNNSLKEEESDTLTLLHLCRNVHQQRLADVDSNKDLDFNGKNQVCICNHLLYMVYLSIEFTNSTFWAIGFT